MKMPFSMRIPFTFFFQIASLLVLIFFCLDCQANSSTRQYNFVVKEAPYTRLCSTKKILTVNGKFPGPTLRVRRGDTIFVMVHNKGRHNITIHWHGVAQPRNPWSDGPEYITQCPIQPGGKFNQKIIFSTEEGTVWWHAHSDWSRATVHGAIFVYPKHGTSYPFPKPHKEVPIILGEWWKKDVAQVLEGLLTTGGEHNTSDALTINGQPGDLYECSKSDTFKLLVDRNKIYLLRIVNAAMNTILFFSIAKHNLIVVGSDGSYTNPLTTNYITISPGQTIDALLITNQNHSGHYYMAARAYSSGTNVSFDNTTTTAILQYSKRNENDVVSSQMLLPYLPNYNDRESAFDFITKLRSLGDKDHPINVPLNITTKLFSTVSINTFPCQKNASCEGPNGTRLAASMNNISFVQPSLVNILDAYYYHINGVFQNDFPRFPPLLFDFTAEYLPLELELPKRATKVKVLDYGSTVEVIFQGTNLVAGIDHPMHLHGYNFYVVGYGFGNFDEERDKLGYNLVDPPLLNTVLVPKNGWTTVRFTADNPGVWFMHCHLERHLTWGMQAVFVVKDGKNPKAKLLPRPSDMPPC